MKKSTILLILILVGIRHTFAQGFVNLDFESANLSGYSAGSVPATDAIPGWTAYLGGTPLTNINYNTGGSVEIVGSSAMQGNFYIRLQSGGSSSTEPSIGQTGTIPETAQSLIWWGIVAPVVLSFNGQTLSFSMLGPATGSAFIYGVDISSFAGQTGQLLFASTSPLSLGPSFIDNIQFSSSPIPESSAVSLLLLGGGVLIYAHRNHKSRVRTVP